MKLAFVTRTPTNEIQLVKFRLPIKEEPYFDQELSWLACIHTYALQGIDLRGHNMMECVVSCSGQPCTFSEWTNMAFRITLPTATYTEHRRILEGKINEVFNPNTETSDMPGGVDDDNFDAESESDLH